MGGLWTRRSFLKLEMGLWQGFLKSPILVLGRVYNSHHVAVVLVVSLEVLGLECTTIIKTLLVVDRLGRLRVRGVLSVRLLFMLCYKSPSLSPPPWVGAWKARR